MPRFIAIVHFFSFLFSSSSIPCEKQDGGILLVYIILLFIICCCRCCFRFVHLAARPQVNLRSSGRRRFAHLSDSGEEIQVDANIPWGSTTLFTLEFRDDSRLYAVHTANNRYLSRDGRLLEQCGPTCLFSLEYHAGALALRDTQGLYLAPLGSKVLL